EDIAAGREPERLRPEFSDGQVRVLHAEYTPLRATVELESPAGATIHYLALYYPGWQVRVDGEPVPIAPSQPDGLLTFNVPAGRHTLHIRFVETPGRIVADGVSLFSVLALGLALWAAAREPQSFRRESTHAIRN
ncbi:MAG: YfhO family protein, partial [Anaerolineales bacterium]|nr:YfhO family protein [Anaerolineales bacterium]